MLCRIPTDGSTPSFLITHPWRPLHTGLHWQPPAVAVFWNWQLSSHHFFSAFLTPTRSKLHTWGKKTPPPRCPTAQASKPSCCQCPGFYIILHKPFSPAFTRSIAVVENYQALSPPIETHHSFPFTRTACKPFFLLLNSQWLSTFLSNVFPPLRCWPILSLALPTGTDLCNFLVIFIQSLLWFQWKHISMCDSIKYLQYEL